MDIDLLGFSVLSKLNWFFYVGRKSLSSSASTELDLVFVWVIEIDLNLQCVVSNLTTRYN